VKRTFSILMILAVLVSAAGLALAYGDGNYRKGKYLFRKDCRACHMENAPGTVQAKPFDPLSMTMDGWTKAFSAEAAATYQCQDEWKKLSEEDINDIYTYLHKHASDSPTPAKCK